MTTSTTCINRPFYQQHSFIMTPPPQTMSASFSKSRPRTGGYCYNGGVFGGSSNHSSVRRKRNRDDDEDSCESLHDDSMKKRQDEHENKRIRLGRDRMDVDMLSYTGNMETVTGQDEAMDMSSTMNGMVRSVPGSRCFAKSTSRQQEEHSVNPAEIKTVSTWLAPTRHGAR